MVVNEGCTYEDDTLVTESAKDTFDALYTVLNIFLPCAEVVSEWTFTGRSTRYSGSYSLLRPMLTKAGPTKTRQSYYSSDQEGILPCGPIHHSRTLDTTSNMIRFQHRPQAHSGGNTFSILCVTALQY